MRFIYLIMQLHSYRNLFAFQPHNRFGWITFPDFRTTIEEILRGQYLAICRQRELGRSRPCVISTREAVDKSDGHTGLAGLRDQTSFEKGITDGEVSVLLTGKSRWHN